MSDRKEERLKKSATHPLKPGFASTKTHVVHLAMLMAMSLLVIAGIAGYAMAYNVGLFICWALAVSWLLFVITEEGAHEKVRHWTRNVAATLVVVTAVALAADARFIIATLLLVGFFGHWAYCDEVREAHARKRDSRESET